MLNKEEFLRLQIEIEFLEDIISSNKLCYECIKFIKKELSIKVNDLNKIIEIDNNTGE